MSHRLQVLIPGDLEVRIRKAAQRLGISKGEWVRRAIEEALRRRAQPDAAGKDPLERLQELSAPTADIEVMLGEIDSGRQ